MRPAKALQGLAKTELRGVLDKLLLQAAKNYWEWALSYQRQELLRQNAELAAVRLRTTRERVRQDDLAAINSIETLTELLNRQAQLVQLVQARVQWQNPTLQLSSYLYDEQQQPRELPATTVRPQLPGPADWRPLPPDSLATLVEQARLRHPELQKSRAKLAQLWVESRLLRNLPKLNLNYHLLQVGPLFEAENGLVLNSAYLQNNS